ncbi:LRR receptor-like serine/threonine-protein kinase GSO2 [Salvia miltiorrhiza]|uniref:LRR receptor-like serine/threonine-protein kinase GSO2 n=1 Tax=Salvia miltiorrhiza TaxID=226208 RepID=UPI0025AC61EB|nr:LRR receptor-like serine/threonine-protein kinase GSO2 [Salvia miltiorrhiza]
MPQHHRPPYSLGGEKIFPPRHLDRSIHNPNFCAWRGVSCSGGSVVALNIANCSMRGSISPALAVLPNLLHLNLSSDHLSGPIPPALSNLSSLESLLLLSNQLSGPITPQLGSLLNLCLLRIGDNYLTGFIPPQLANLHNLVALGLASCSLTGPIPPQLGMLPNLQTLLCSRTSWRDLSSLSSPRCCGSASHWRGHKTAAESVSGELGEEERCGSHHQ